MRTIFVNLPVADLERSKAFFTAIGFTNDPRFTDGSAAMMTWSETIAVMLLTHARFADFIVGEIAPASAGTSKLLCLSCDSRDEVAAIKRAALAEGARAWKPDADHGFMVQASFADPDGHVWELAWMDPAALTGDAAPPASA